MLIWLIDLNQGPQPRTCIPLSSTGEHRWHSVSFFKSLIDSAGHPVDACQGTVEVSASTEDRAIDVAELKFAAVPDVGNWSLRADYEKVELLPAHKRTSAPAWRAYLTRDGGRPNSKPR